MSYLDEFEDLKIFTAGEFSDLAVVVSSVARRANPNPLQISGIFDERSDPMFTGSAEGRSISFLIETEAALGLNHGARLTIKGKDYQIVGINPMTDGKLTSLELKESVN